MIRPARPDDYDASIDRRVLVLLLTGLAFALRLAWLSQTAHPTGTDGYYYVVQVADWSTTGALHVTDGSWVLRALGALGWGFEPIVAVKVGACVLAAATVPAGWWAGERIRPGGGIWVAALLAASPTVTQLAGDFAKNLGMAAPLLVLIGAVAKRPTRWEWALVVPCGVLCVSAHRLGAALAVLVLLGGALGAVGERVQVRGWHVALAAAGVAALVAALSLVPGMLHPSDLERLSGQVDLRPHWPAPWGFQDLRPAHPAQWVELSWPWLAGGLGIALWIRHPRDRPWVTGVGLAGAVCLVVPWRLDQLDLGYRLALMAPLLAAPLAALVPAAGPLQNAVLVGPLVALFGFQPTQHPPYERYLRVIDRLPEQPELLIAHQGINFLYDHVTGGEAMAWAPEPELDPDTVGRIAWGIEPGEWPAGHTVRTLDADYTYVRESTWNALVDQAQDPELIDRITDWHNPTRVRPESLTRGR